MSPSEWAEEGSRDLMSDDCHSFSAGVVLYADMRGELGGERGMNKFPSTIGTFRYRLWRVGGVLSLWLAQSLTSFAVNNAIGRAIEQIAHLVVLA